MCILKKLLSQQNLIITNRVKIVLFKSIRNSKRRNKGNFTSKSTKKQDKVGWGWGTTLSCFNIFHVKGLKRFTFYVKLI